MKLEINGMVKVLKFEDIENYDLFKFLSNDAIYAKLSENKMLNIVTKEVINLKKNITWRFAPVYRLKVKDYEMTLRISKSTLSSSSGVIYSQSTLQIMAKDLEIGDCIIRDNIPYLILSELVDCNGCDFFMIYNLNENKKERFFCPSKNQLCYTTDINKLTLDVIRGEEYNAHIS